MFARFVERLHPRLGQRMGQRPGYRRGRGMGTAEPADFDIDLSCPFPQRIAVLDADPFVMVADAEAGLISVFDELHYDRADLDVLSPPMRRHALGRLRPLGFEQRSGRELVSPFEDIVIHLPKFHALGGSPFDALRDTSMRQQDYVLLTPTQAAAQIVNTYDLEAAVERVKRLVVKHPVNLLRLADFLDRSGRHRAFGTAIGHLMYVQRKAVCSEPLKTRRPLR